MITKKQKGVTIKNIFLFIFTLQDWPNIQCQFKPVTKNLSAQSMTIAFFSQQLHTVLDVILPLLCHIDVVAATAETLQALYLFYCLCCKVF